MVAPRPDIRIFVACHKPSRLVDGKVFTPIHLGRALTSAAHKDGPASAADLAWMRRHMIGDDTGDHISDLNRSFCELTAQYWAWKNVEADYYGFCHYRRYLAFTGHDVPVAGEERNNGCIAVDHLDDRAIETFGLSDEVVTEVVPRYDAVLCRPVQLRPMGIRDNVDAMRRSPDWHDVRDMERALAILERRSPQLAGAARRYMRGGANRLYNAFVMRRDLFQDYCEWLFGILFELNEVLAMRHYGLKKERTPATIAERLCGIWCQHLQEQGRHRILEVPLVFFEDTSVTEEVRPAFGEQGVTVVANFDEAYAPAFSVFLGSALRHFSPRARYDILVVSGGIAAATQSRLRRILDGVPNASLRFVDPRGILAGLELPVAPQYTRDMYHRVVIPYLLPYHTRAVVIDVDTICLADLQELHEAELAGNLVGAVRDIVAQGYINGACARFRRNVLQTLALARPYDYVNTGVMVMDLEAIRREFPLARVLEFMTRHRGGVFEQDMMNVLFAGRIAFLDPRWNVFAITNKAVGRAIDDFAPAADVTAYRAARLGPAIIHYADRPKPWHDPRIDFASEFWSFARQSSWYECLLADMQRRQAELACGRLLGWLRALMLRLSYYRHKMLAGITWGRVRHRSQQHRSLLKREIAAVRDAGRS